MLAIDSPQGQIASKFARTGDGCGVIDFNAIANPGIQRLRAYDRGHDLVALRHKHPMLVELGSNENNHGTSPKAKQAVLDALNGIHIYPDPSGSELKQAIAAHHGIARESILLGNGSHELLMQLAQVFAGPDAGVLASQYGFAVYALAAHAAAAPLALAQALPESSAMPRGHDLQAMASAIAPGTRLVYLANPNNPTGTWFSAADFGAFMAQVPENVLVVVDEAYAEFVDAPDWASAIGLLSAHPNLILTRTFSKAHALAGLRVGYALAHSDCVAVMERLRESFNVNTLALAAARAALGDGEHLRWCVARNAEQRRSLAEALAARGLKVSPSQTNFLLVDFATQAAAIEVALLGEGIVLRPMAGYGLPNCLRITVGTESENRRLLQALDKVLP